MKRIVRLRSHAQGVSAGEGHELRNLALEVDAAAGDRFKASAVRLASPSLEARRDAAAVALARRKTRRCAECEVGCAIPATYATDRAPGSRVPMDMRPAHQADPSPGAKCLRVVERQRRALARWTRPPVPTGAIRVSHA